MISNIYENGDSNDNYSEDENAEFAIHYKYDTTSSIDNSNNNNNKE